MLEYSQKRWIRDGLDALRLLKRWVRERKQIRGDRHYGQEKTFIELDHPILRCKGRRYAVY